MTRPARKREVALVPKALAPACNRFSAEPLTRRSDRQCTLSSSARPDGPRRRWRPNKEQLMILESVYASMKGNPVPIQVQVSMPSLRDHGGVTEFSIGNWFRNRKNKEKQQHKEEKKKEEEEEEEKQETETEKEEEEEEEEEKPAAETEKEQEEKPAADPENADAKLNVEILLDHKSGFIYSWTQ